jgi:hypothetical protein
MIILYGIMFLVMRGFILIDNGIHWRTSSNNRVHIDLDEAESEEERETRAIANLLLLYVPGDLTPIPSLTIVHPMLSTATQQSTCSVCSPTVSPDGSDSQAHPSHTNSASLPVPCLHSRGCSTSSSLSSPGLNSSQELRRRIRQLLNETMVMSSLQNHSMHLRMA